MTTVERLQELAAARGLTLFQMAKLCGLNYNTLKSAADRNNQLSVETIIQVCDALQITLGEFFAKLEKEAGRTA